MGKSYYKKDVEKMCNEIVEKTSASLVNDSKTTPEQAVTIITELKIFRKYSDELLKEMDELDIKYDAEMEAWRAEMEEKKAAEAAAAAAAEAEGKTEEKSNGDNP